MVHLKSKSHKQALLGVVCFCSLFNVTATDVKPDELAGQALQKIADHNHQFFQYVSRCFCKSYPFPPFPKRPKTPAVLFVFRSGLWAWSPMPICWGVPVDDFQNSRLCSCSATGCYIVATLLLPRTHPNALKTSRSPDLKGQLTCSPRNYGKKAKFEKLKENTFWGFVTFTVGSLGGVGVSGLEKCFSTLPERITSPFPSRHGLESMNWTELPVWWNMDSFHGWYDLSCFLIIPPITDDNLGGYMNCIMHNKAILINCI